MKAAALAELHAKCFSVPRPYTSAEFAAFEQDPNVFIVETANGFSLGRVAADEAELLTLAIAPHARRRGEGRAALNSFETKAASRGALTVFLEVSANNQAAIALYNASGYEMAGRRNRYYSDGSDAVLMTKSLS